MRRAIATSNHWLPRFLRRSRKAVYNFGVPAPKVLTVPFARTITGIRSVYYFLMRVFVCEPFFKAHCTRYGSNVHTGVFLHWIQGRGEILLGNNVLLDGKCNMSFAARFTDKPTLSIGDHTGIGHGCAFTVGRRISIGRHCRIAGNVWMFDSPGHAADPVARLAGAPAADDEVRPVTIEDNVWIGERAIIMPGVTVGEGSIVVAASVVMADVPPYTMVAGNPARQMKKLTPPSVDVQVQPA